MQLQSIRRVSCTGVFDLHLRRRCLCACEAVCHAVTRRVVLQRDVGSAAAYTRRRGSPVMRPAVESVTHKVRKTLLGAKRAWHVFTTNLTGSAR